ncbi:YcxB family protein [Pullulanibacillus sp. KACC 23026]|uniref:YcxB family protein n=1 Tax=Pullulanibacillus sp. KACC 23026 TaxID=3028315 RepID=UPI0023AF83E5|nr:YcxB family protein [Pullulanibacillus sp. KACC 23026]WEG14395.1 YcxB family protein [Pullulanibacillus sp. KACC 23026]
MEIDHLLKKRLYRRILRREMGFGRLNSWFILIFYLVWWKIAYDLTKVGQLKTNVPLLAAVSLVILLLLIYQFIVTRSYIKNTKLLESVKKVELHKHQLLVEAENATVPYAYKLETLTKVTETKNGFLLYFKGKQMIPLPKAGLPSIDEARDCLAAHKTIRHSYWLWTFLLFILMTVYGVYQVGQNAVQFHGALAWKISELKTDSHTSLKDDNFYTSGLSGILDNVKKQVTLEPYLMTNDLEVDFDKDGTITSIDTYIYGYDKNERLQAGYLIYYDRDKSNRVTIHKQDWNGDGTTAYDPNNDLSIVINMVKNIPIKKEVDQWNQPQAAILYKGIRNWGYNLSGIRFIHQDGRIIIPTLAEEQITGPTVSLYVPGMEDTLTPERYVYQP